MVVVKSAVVLEIGSDVSRPTYWQEEKWPNGKDSIRVTVYKRHDGFITAKADAWSRQEERKMGHTMLLVTVYTELWVKKKCDHLLPQKSASFTKCILLVCSTAFQCLQGAVLRDSEHLYQALSRKGHS